MEKSIKSANLPLKGNIVKKRFCMDFAEEEDNYLFFNIAPLFILLRHWSNEELKPSNLLIQKTMQAIFIPQLANWLF